MSTVRSVAERAATARAQLESEIDVWVASASAAGDAHLIPLSYLWDGSSVVLSTPERSRTARDLFRAGVGRAALPPTRSVVILAGDVERLDPALEPDVVDAFARRHEWDPRLEPTPYAFLRIVAREIHAWAVAEELSTRAVYAGGIWADQRE
jgi:hypothetical protein